MAKPASVSSCCSPPTPRLLLSRCAACLRVVRGAKPEPFNEPGACTVSRCHPAPRLLSVIGKAKRTALLFLCSPPLFSFSVPFAPGGRLIILGGFGTRGPDAPRRLIILGNLAARRRSDPRWRRRYLLLMIHLLLLQ